MTITDGVVCLRTHALTVKKCPFCGRPHYHGFPEGTSLDKIQWRVSHCLSNKQDYGIQIVEVQP